MKSMFHLITVIAVSSLCSSCSKETDKKTTKLSTNYLSEIQSWKTSSDVSSKSLASLRALYVSNALENLRSDYDGSPLEGIVLEINQNNSVSIWVETTLSRKHIVSRFREDSNGYENKSDSEILESITPWCYDAFKYACLEFSCTGDFKELAQADMEFCEGDFDNAEDDDLYAVSRDATIDAILKIEESKVLEGFEQSSTFEVRIFSDENDTLSSGEHCWATNKLLVRAREKAKS